MHLQFIDISCIVAYLVIMVMIGWHYRKKARQSKESYLLGGKRLPWYLLGLSDASDMFDISGTMWMVALCFVYGFKSIWIPWLWPVFNQVFNMMYLSKWFRRSNADTGAEWLATRFGLKEKITGLIHLFLHHIISSKNNHLILFFDDEWNPRSNTISYGHDIEAAWLVQEAAEIVGDKDLLQAVKTHSVLVAGAAEKGLDRDGGLWYEYDANTKHLVKQKHWWPQAEAMVGFFNTWQITGDETYFQHSLRSWEFVKQYIRDNSCGEWVWRVNEDYSFLHEDKVGLWKCPYHNSRSCIEIIRRIESVPASIVENSNNAKKETAI